MIMETMPRVAEIIRQYYPTVTIKLYDLTEDSLLNKKKTPVFRILLKYHLLVISKIFILLQELLR